MGNKFKGMVMGVVTIVVAVVLFPIILTGVGTAVATNNINSFTALSTIMSLVPLLALIGMITAGGLMTFASATGRGGSTNIMKVVWGELIIFLFITLFPILITTFYDLIVADNNTYTGFTPIAKIVPLLLLVGGLFGGGMLMFQGSGAKGYVSSYRKRHAKKR